MGIFYDRYADRAKQIVCKAVVNEDPNAKVGLKCFRLGSFSKHTYELKILYYWLRDE